MNILLLEDDSAVGDSIVRALELRGHEVHWCVYCEDVEKLLEFGNLEGFDFAILDYQVGLRYGTEVLHLIDFPVVGYSGLPETMKRAAPGLKVFSKRDPLGLLYYVEDYQADLTARSA